MRQSLVAALLFLSCVKPVHDEAHTSFYFSSPHNFKVLTGPLSDEAGHWYFSHHDDSGDLIFLTRANDKVSFSVNTQAVEATSTNIRDYIVTTLRDLHADVSELEFCPYVEDGIQFAVVAGGNTIRVVMVINDSSRIVMIGQYPTADESAAALVTTFLKNFKVEK
jgi:hypothetical protein